MKSDIIIIALCLTAHCLYEYKYIRKYKMGYTYTAESGEAIIEYKYARGRQLQAKINHVIEVKNKRKIVFMKIENNNLYLKDVIVIDEGEYKDISKDTKFKMKSIPGEIFVGGFKIEILKLNQGKIKYYIKEEPEYLRQKTFLGLNSSNAVEKKKSSGKGLQY